MARSFMLHENITERIIAAAIEVHRELGPGLLESVYSECLAHEMKAAGLKFEKEKDLPVRYKDVFIDCFFRMDFVVEDKIILEMKPVEKILKVHEAQLLTYMKLSNIRVGLLMNFNSEILKNGIKRFIL